LTVKVVKKDSPEKDLLLIRQFIDVLKSDCADIRRRVNGIITPIEKKIEEWERLEKLLS
jgi:hypothetical protein